jgi:hypothetical protein
LLVKQPPAGGFTFRKSVPRRSAAMERTASRLITGCCVSGASPAPPGERSITTRTNLTRELSGQLSHRSALWMTWLATCQCGANTGEQAIVPIWFAQIANYTVAQRPSPMGIIWGSCNQNRWDVSTGQSKVAP